MHVSPAFLWTCSVSVTPWLLSWNKSMCKDRYHGVAKKLYSMPRCHGLDGQAIRWVKSGWVIGFRKSWSNLRVSGIPQGSALDICCLTSVTWRRWRTACSSHLRVVANWQDLAGSCRSRLPFRGCRKETVGTWWNSNSLKFKVRCQVLYLERKNLWQQQHRLGSGWHGEQPCW